MLFMFSGGRSKLNPGNRGSVFPHSDVEPDSDNETDRGRFAVKKTFYLHHRKVKFMDKYIPKTLVHALISSRVDYCNSVLYGAFAVHLRPLQSALNGAAD